MAPRNCLHLNQMTTGNHGTSSHLIYPEYTRVRPLLWPSSSITTIRIMGKAKWAFSIEIISYNTSPRKQLTTQQKMQESKSLRKSPGYLKKKNQKIALLIFGVKRQAVHSKNHRWSTQHCHRWPGKGPRKKDKFRYRAPYIKGVQAIFIAWRSWLHDQLSGC